jgi:modulator of FtsH protease
MNIQSAYAARPALDERVRKTLSNTFITVGAMWLVAAATAFLARGMQMGLGMMLGLFVASLAVMFGVYKFRDSSMGLALLALFAAIDGLVLGPLLRHYLGLAGGTELVMTAAGLTGAATFGCALYATTSRRSFSHWGSFLFAGMLVLLVASLIALFVQSTLLHLVISAVGALLFTAYLLYDISNIVTGRETNYVIASLTVFLNMFNLFLHLLRLLGILSADD